MKVYRRPSVPFSSRSCGWLAATHLHIYTSSYHTLRTIPSKPIMCRQSSSSQCTCGCGRPRQRRPQDVEGARRQRRRGRRWEDEKGPAWRTGRRHSRVGAEPLAAAPSPSRNPTLPAPPLVLRRLLLPLVAVVVDAHGLQARFGRGIALWRCTGKETLPVWRCHHQ